MSLIVDSEGSLMTKSNGIMNKSNSTTATSASAFRPVASSSNPNASSRSHVDDPPPPPRVVDVRGRIPSSPTSTASCDSQSPPAIHHVPPDDSSVNNDVDDDDDDNDNDGREGRSGVVGDTTFSWPSHSNYDEQRELLGTEEESSELPTSDEDDDRKNVWSITKEQLNYYTTQFLSMQPNPRGVIPGVLAKEFFEKSRLPIIELRKIWQLSDVSKDGCLSLEEFLTAMHLVVLRRNEIELPESLPSCLRPLDLRQKLLIDRRNKDLYDNSKSGKSPVSSPKPVNFDFQRDLKRDPNIVAPVAVRLSPDSPCIQSSDDEDEKAAVSKKTKHGMREVVYEQLWNQEDAASTTEESLSSLTIRNNNNNAVKKNLSDDNDDNNNTDGDEDALDSGPVSLPPAVNPLGLMKKEGSPPPPPPRIGQKTHARSSSLDLNRFNDVKRNGGRPPNQTAPPPPPPPRYISHRGMSMDSSSLSSSSISTTTTMTTTSSSTMTGIADSSTTTSTLTSASKMLQSAGEELLHSNSANARSFHQTIHNLKETNSVVARTINELHQEVSDALEERIALEYQLEQLKSFGE